jgi:hypothetical protein
MAEEIAARAPRRGRRNGRRTDDFHPRCGIQASRSATGPKVLRPSRSGAAFASSTLDDTSWKTDAHSRDARCGVPHVRCGHRMQQRIVRERNLRQHRSRRHAVDCRERRRVRDRPGRRASRPVPPAGAYVAASRGDVSRARCGTASPCRAATRGTEPRTSSHAGGRERARSRRGRGPSRGRGTSPTRAGGRRAGASAGRVFIGRRGCGPSARTRSGGTPSLAAERV